MKNRTHIPKFFLGLVLILPGLPCSADARTTPFKGNGKIAFVIGRYDGYQHSGISVMNPDGSGRTQLTATQILCPQPNRPRGSCGPDQLDYSPSWSPDGKQIAFIRSVPAPNFRYVDDVFVMNADGSDQRRLTQIGSVDFFSRPTWSPDGTKLAFVGPPVGDYYSQIYVMNADGSGLRPIGPGVDPAWSPDGSKLAFASGGLYLMNPDGSGRTQVTAPKNASPNLSDYDWKPVWSPDGMRILFIRSVGCDWDDNCESITIWTVNADGSNPAKLADVATNCLDWSPDGTKIVFQSLNSGGLFTMEADGSNITRLTNTPDEAQWLPSWQAVPLIPSAIDDTQFFVRQHYRDFLNREPDADGFANWLATLQGCANGGFGEFDSPDCDRVHVSAGFVQSYEFQGRGYWILRFGFVGLNRSVGSTRSSTTYAEFIPALQQIGGSNSPAQEETAKVAYTNAFVQRTDFQALFPANLSNSQYVNGLESNAGVTLANKQALIDGLNNMSMTRADVLRNVVESQVVFEKFIIPSFVTMEYFGYLRRDVDETGYHNWVETLTADPNNYRHMIFGFIYSTEYRQRFGP